MLKSELVKMQDLSLEEKIKASQTKILEWCLRSNWNVYVSFSGGKDSTVLLDLVCYVWANFAPRKKTLDVVFVDTGLEYPEIKQFVHEFVAYLNKKHNIKLNLIKLKPEKNFKEVIEKEGFPVTSKETALKIRQAQTLPKDSKSYILRMTGYVNKTKKFSTIGIIPKKWKYLVDAPFKVSEKCCDIMKKKPIKLYEKKNKKSPFVGTMASDSRNRLLVYLKDGCNSFNRNISTPLGFWLENDVLHYLFKFNLPYCKIYGELKHCERELKFKLTGLQRTGCMFCMFGVHMEKGENRFQKMKKTHPKLYNYCINDLGLGKVLDYINVKY